jgi:hypothetical protein
MIIRLTRPRSAAGSPMKKSSPAGPAISSAKNVPTLRPDTRLITSPTSQPNVRLVEIQLAALREQVRARRRGRLGGRVHQLQVSLATRSRLPYQ